MIKGMKIASAIPMAPDPMFLGKLEAEAVNNINPTAEAVEKFRQELEAACGMPIRVMHNVPGLDTHGVLRSAWASAQPRSEHLIELRSSEDSFHSLHFLAHELAHIELQLQAGKAGVLRQPRGQIAKLLAYCGIGQGHPRLETHQQNAINVITCIMDIPWDMIVEARLAERFPMLAPAQRHWALTHEFERAVTVQTANDPSENALPAMRRAYTAVSGAVALAWDALLKDTHLSDFYRGRPEWKASKHIYQSYRNHAAHPTPGMELKLIDEVADLVGFKGLFRWETISVALPAISNKEPALESAAQKALISI